MPTKHSLKMNAILNVIKQCCVIIFPMITFPYASRVLGASGYGKVNFSASLVSYIALLAALGVSNYSIREGARVRTDRLILKRFVDEVYSLNMYLTVIAYFLLGVLLIFWNKLHAYQTIILVQSISVLFTTLGTDWINSIFEDYLFITIRYISCQAIAVVAMLTFVRSKNDIVIYSFISILGPLLANVLNIIHIRRGLHIKPDLVWTKSITRHLKPILIIFGSSVATLIYVNSDITLLGILTDDKTVGLYSVSSKIYSLIKQLMNALLIVAIPRISRGIAKGITAEISAKLNDLLNLLIVVIGPASVGLMLLSRNIVILFAGHAYSEAAPSLSILSLSLIFATIACFFINVVMLPLRLEKFILLATIVSAVANLLLNIVLIPYFGQMAAAVTTVLSELSMVVFGIGYTHKLIRFNVIRSLFVSVAGSIITFLVCTCIQQLHLSNFMTISFSILASCMGLVLVMIIFWHDRVSTLLRSGFFKR